MTYADKKQLVKLVSYMSTFDGGLYKTKSGNSNAQFIMNMRKENLDYVNWVSDVLNNITSTRIADRPDYNTDGYTRQPQVRLESNRHPFLTKIRDRIYINNKKVIDPHMLKLMDAEALAIIFMADGSSYVDTRFKKPHAKLDLNTKGFSFYDNHALSKSIYDRLGIHTNVHKHNKYYYLSVSRKSHVDFIKTVLPYMCDSFMYKLEKLAPVYPDDDIVWSSKELEEVGRNDRSEPTEIGL